MSDQVIQIGLQLHATAAIARSFGMPEKAAYRLAREKLTSEQQKMVTELLGDDKSSPEISRFLKDRIEIDDTASMNATEIYCRFVAWWGNQNNERSRPPSRKALGKALLAAGYRRFKAGTIFYGARVK
jgi:siderophore synthetase component